MTIRTPDISSPRRGRPPKVSKEAILDTVDAKQTSDWTMASIAAELGVSETAIYYYFGSKDGLLAALGARMMADFELPSADAAWDEWLEEFGLRLFAFYRRHPFLQDVDMAANATAQPGSVRLLEEILAYLDSQGFSIENALLACRMILVLVQQVGTAVPDNQGDLIEFAVVEALALDASLSSRAYEVTAQWDPSVEFQALLRVALAGIRAELAPASRRRRSVKR